jgi:hypothetical protein
MHQNRAPDPPHPVARRLGLRTNHKLTIYQGWIKKSLDNQYTYMITCVMLARQITFRHSPNQANSFVPMLLRPLEVSCLSFCCTLPLFSIACSLFFQNTRGGGYPLRRDLQPFCLRTLNRLITPFPTTYPSRAKLRWEDSPVSPFFATHTEAPTASPLLATHPKNRGTPGKPHHQ